ncbi:hypothetical protein HDU76_007496, partial [Blyttiomyces sp. JEL0837]
MITSVASLSATVLLLLVLGSPGHSASFKKGVKVIQDGSVKIPLQEHSIKLDSTSRLGIGPQQLPNPLQKTASTIHNVSLNSEDARYFLLPATVDTKSGNQNFNLHLDISFCYSWVRSVGCVDATGVSCKGAKWDFTGLVKDNSIGSSHYSGVVNITEDVTFDTYKSKLSIAGYSSSMSLGASTFSNGWYSYLGDGVLGLCNPIFYEKTYPYALP